MHCVLAGSFMQPYSLSHAHLIRGILVKPWGLVGSSGSFAKWRSTFVGLHMLGKGWYNVQSVLGKLESL